MLDWIRGTMLTAGKISEEDLALLYVTDEPEDVARHILERYRHYHGRSP
jgi:hypothetical protein